VQRNSDAFLSILSIGHSKNGSTLKAEKANLDMRNMNFEGVLDRNAESAVIYIEYIFQMSLFTVCHQIQD